MRNAGGASRLHGGAADSFLMLRTRGLRMRARSKSKVDSERADKLLAGVKAKRLTLIRHSGKPYG
jgi:hypothetical protein